MFQKNIDDRLSSWAYMRARLENSEHPFDDVWNFWKPAPFVPYNNRVDPYYQQSWPTPWEIIVENKYDDFTKALMIGWSLKLTNRFKDSNIEIRTIVDSTKTSVYNICCVNEDLVINFSDNGPIPAINVPDYFLVENLVELKTPR